MADKFNPYLEAALLQRQAGEIGLDKLSDHETDDGIQGTISPLDFPMELGSLLVGASRKAMNPAMWREMMGQGGAPGMGLPAFGQKDGMNMNALSKMLQDRADSEAATIPIRGRAYKQMRDAMKEKTDNVVSGPWKKK
jgi:hypothetical protein